MEYYTKLGEKERELLDDIRRRETIPLLSHQLTNPLREETKASVAVAYGLVSKSCLYTQEMGIGKTYVAMGLIENLLRRNPDKKILFCGTNFKMKEYVRDFEHNLSRKFKVVYTTGEGETCKESFKKIKDAHVMICTHSVWDSTHIFHKEFIPLLDQFQAFLLDESGMVLKSDNNYAYRMMVEFVPQLEFKYAFNATPIEKDLSLLINQCRVLGIPIPSKGALFGNHAIKDEEEGYRWVFRNLDELKEKLKYHIFNVSRADLHTINKGIINYHLDEHLLTPTNKQIEYANEYGNKELRFPFHNPDIFTPSQYPSLQKLIEICVKSKMEGRKMVVYVHNVKPKGYIKNYLEMMGLSVGIYDGTHTPTKEEKDRVNKEYEEGKYDVLLTNMIYGLSLNNANHVIMYDLPSNFYQFMYRAVRDLENRDLYVSVIVYDTENDYLAIKSQVDLERHENEFSDRKFYIVEELLNRLKRR